MSLNEWIEYPYGNLIPTPSLFLCKVLFAKKCDSFVGKTRGSLNSIF